MHNIVAEPAYLLNPGVFVLDDGIMIAAVFRGDESCGLILYRISDGIQVKIPFTDDYRFGSLYCAKIRSLLPSEWGYRFYTGSVEFIDPGARSIITVKSGGKDTRIGGFFYKPDHVLPACRSKYTGNGSSDIIYSFHVRGLTMLDSGIRSVPGTFSAAAEKVGYFKDLGITAVEIMPVYESQPVTRPDHGPRTMEDALALYPVNVQGLPIRDLSVPKVNYWGYTRGFYYAPNSRFSTPGYEGGAQKEFADMVSSFHDAGISVFLQLYFPATVTSQAQTDIARFYVTHYDIDGFHLLGSVADIRSFTSDPLLSDTRIFHTDFPYVEIREMDAENPETGMISTGNLYDHNSHFSVLLRRFAKSDDYVMREFLSAFLKSPDDHGVVRYVCSGDGFTLRDLVSYNEKHNEENGEGGLDGTDNNYSWNCGTEGDSDSEDVLRLRRNQIRNMLTLLFLSQGTPLLNAGDECYNTQYGNNNPYCQDNETGWVSWDNGETGDHIRDFVRKIIRFRNANPVFTSGIRFKSTDYRGFGYPDLSLHGKEAWKPDLSFYSHSIGICVCENYVRDSEKTELLYIAVNMHWEKQELGLPKLSPGRRWNLLVDTAQEESFMETECIPDEQHVVEVEARSVKILNTVTSSKPVRRRKKKTVIKPEVKPEDRTEIKPEDRTEIKPEDKAEIKPEEKAEKRPDNKTQEKTEEKPLHKTELKEEPVSAESAVLPQTVPESGQTGQSAEE